MKEKHLQIRVEQLLALSKASNCPRKKFGAMLIDPTRNVVLMDGYNGAPRGGSKLCGGSVCLRTEQKISSGQRVEIGCHHAEMNVICNSAANGVKTQGAWLIVTGEPCLMCAKLIHHAGIETVVVVKGGYSVQEGINYLEENRVKVNWYLGESKHKYDRLIEETKYFEKFLSYPLDDCDSFRELVKMGNEIVPFLMENIEEDTILKSRILKKLFPE